VTTDCPTTERMPQECGRGRSNLSYVHMTVKWLTSGIGHRTAFAGNGPAEPANHRIREASLVFGSIAPASGVVSCGRFTYPGYGPDPNTRAVLTLTCCTADMGILWMEQAAANDMRLRSKPKTKFPGTSNSSRHYTWFSREIDDNNYSPSIPRSRYGP